MRTNKFRRFESDKKDPTLFRVFMEKLVEQFAERLMEMFFKFAEKILGLKEDKARENRIANINRELDKPLFDKEDTPNA